MANSTHSAWKSRTILQLRPSAMRNLKRGRHAQLMHKGAWFELIPSKKNYVMVGKHRVKATPEQIAAIRKILVTT